ncbi:SNF1-interacting protein [Recurvomyces mirabilis]|uniref:SNF1-interacting protein n=1 Tax=Recurvomyces mirabilis TaxID=574656 RepID=A0AAE0WMW9_9PEZI|nr:SNF1-interacting protein [Recurvomyces mirabilis]KAK5152741.1 SNF1-interacting protein [Recurvomyces mirabilis]
MADNEDSTTSQSSLTTVNQPLNLIPVTLKEAALDSPTFRATSLHFADQIDIIERWLDGYVRAATKLAADVSTLEHAVNNFLTQSAPPAQVSEAALDHDYTLLAMRRYGEGAREWWGSMLKGAKRYDSTVVEPIKAFQNAELKNFKEARRALESTQKTFDHVISRYLGQNKTKEASSLREDAFQLHEARKAYLKASMDFCVLAPTVRASLDKLIVRVFADQWKEMKGAREGNASLFAKWTGEMERVRGWSREMENSERAFKRELLTARRQIEDEAQSMTKPSRELEDYAASTVPYLGTGASTASGMASPAKPQQTEKNEKQSWLYQKTSVGKPARTVWSRRWFFVKNGIFGWLIQGARSGGVEESERIGVLLCGVRPAFQEERRFCFEVKTKDSSIVLQAETQQELTEWISAFEMAKRKALEDPASTDSPGVGTGGIDPAFAISPPVAPEFAAKVDTAHGADDSTPSQVSMPEREASFGPAASRSSFDVSQPPPPSARRVLSLEREPGEGNREHAARIMSKLDLSKRSAPSGQYQSSASPAGGIASLISASHNVLPVGPGAAPVASPSTPGFAQDQAAKRSVTMPYSTLAPSTLANPPAATNLSHTAVIVSGEKGVNLGRGNDGSGMPSGLMANLWGSNNWGYVNRLGLEPPKKERKMSSVSPSRMVSLVQSQDDVNVMDGGRDTQATLSSNPLASDTDLAAGIKHRKTLSIATDTPVILSSRSVFSDDKDEFPSYYPLPLKAQQAQFRMLFPSAPRNEKVVLVFRATWNPNEQEFPGRVYITSQEVYFYSNHLGLVLVTGASLRGITDVTAAPGRDCDYLYLHMRPRHSEIGQDEEDLRRITIKVFLEPLRLLQRRLNYLVHNANSEEPAALEEVLKTLIKMESEDPKRSSSVESWEDVVYDPETPDTRAGDQQRTPNGRREHNVKTALRIDGTLFDNRGGPAKTGREVQKFKLPTQAVIYSPQGMQASMSRDFNVSAKALFHVIFGDKSAVFQLLYCNRWADKTVQSPWVKKAGDGAHWTRQFSSAEQATPMRDEQRIDVYNDHLCYVVTNTKVPWKLPYSSRFTPTTKMVITHTAKSKCKFAIFQAMTWTQAPRWLYVRHLVEQQALNSLEADALDLSNVAMDQVAKLGHHSKTNRAIEIFGSVGQQTEAQQIDAASIPKLGNSLSGMKSRAPKPVNLTRLIVDDVLQKILRSIGWMMDVGMALSKSMIGVFTAHTLLIALLAFSALYNSWYGYREGLTWWQDRSAGRFMARVGVKPQPMLSRAVYLSDINELIAQPELQTVLRAGGNATAMAAGAYDRGDGKTCLTTFTDQLTSSISQPSSASSQGSVRLHHTRDSLARYRHDLLVALRVVNRVERDVVEAEWEEYLYTETKKCMKVEKMVTGSDKKGKQSQVDVEGELGKGFMEYCNSCRSDLAGMKKNGTNLLI